MTVNGTEDVTLEWDAIHWRLHEDNVRRLRRRIFKAAQGTRPGQGQVLAEDDAAVLVEHAGQRAAGHAAQHRPRDGGHRRGGRVDLRRPGWRWRCGCTAASAPGIPCRSSGCMYRRPTAKLRPLGIPVIMDRCHQNRVKNALEPEWEARFEPRSYGFRPGRSCQDAIEAIYDTCKGRGAARVWTLDADLAAAFDKLDHDHLHVGDRVVPRPGNDPGVAEGGRVRAGQGIRAHRGGQPAGRRHFAAVVERRVAWAGGGGRGPVRTRRQCRTDKPNSPVAGPIRDDFVVCCHTRQQAEQVKAQLAEWLAPRGLAFNEDKTRIVSLEAGYDFLGFNVRRYRNGKLLIKPSKAAVKRVKRKLAEQMRRLRGQNASAVLATISPITRGWASFYRSVVSKKTFATVDDYMWKLTYKWACRSHPGQTEALGHQTVLRPVQPVQAQQVGVRRRHQRRLPAPMVWTPIIRHRKVTGGASPDDPALTDYWNQRRGRNQPPLDRSTLRLLKTAARALRHLRGPAPARRPGATHSRGMATVAPHHPQSDHQAAHRRTRAGHAG